LVKIFATHWNRSCGRLTQSVHNNRLGAWLVSPTKPLPLTSSMKLGKTRAPFAGNDITDFSASLGRSDVDRSRSRN
jgi:hypothetical protein